MESRTTGNPCVSLRCLQMLCSLRCVPESSPRDTKHCSLSTTNPKASSIVSGSSVGERRTNEFHANVVLLLPYPASINASSCSGARLPQEELRAIQNRALMWWWRYGILLTSRLRLSNIPKWEGTTTPRKAFERSSQSNFISFPHSGYEHVTVYLERFGFGIFSMDPHISH